MISSARSVGHTTTSPVVCRERSRTFRGRTGYRYVPGPMKSSAPTGCEGMRVAKPQRIHCRERSPAAPSGVGRRIRSVKEMAEALPALSRPRWDRAAGVYLTAVTFRSRGVQGSLDPWSASTASKRLDLSWFFFRSRKKNAPLWPNGKKAMAEAPRAPARLRWAGAAGVCRKATDVNRTGGPGVLGPLAGGRRIRNGATFLGSSFSHERRTPPAARAAQKRAPAPPFYSPSRQYPTRCTVRMCCSQPSLRRRRWMWVSSVRVLSPNSSSPQTASYR